MASFRWGGELKSGWLPPYHSCHHCTGEPTLPRRLVLWLRVLTTGQNDGCFLSPSSVRRSFWLDPSLLSLYLAAEVWGVSCYRECWLEDQFFRCISWLFQVLLQTVCFQSYSPPTEFKQLLECSKTQIILFSDREEWMLLYAQNSSCYQLACEHVCIGVFTTKCFHMWGQNLI